jgi:hypothetical protein
MYKLQAVCLAAASLVLAAAAAVGALEPGWYYGHLGGYAVGPFETRELCLEAREADTGRVNGRSCAQRE